MDFETAFSLLCYENFGVDSIRKQMKLWNIVAIFYCPDMFIRFAVNICKKKNGLI